jgi:hypothetical protein
MDEKSPILSVFSQSFQILARTFLSPWYLPVKGKGKGKVVTLLTN